MPAYHVLFSAAWSSPEAQRLPLGWWEARGHAAAAQHPSSNHCQMPSPQVQAGAGLKVCSVDIWSSAPSAWLYPLLLLGHAACSQTQPFWMEKAQLSCKGSRFK